VIAKTLDQVRAIPSFVLTPLTYLGGVFYSVSLLPPWARKLSLADPMLYMVNLLRYSMFGISDVHLGIAVSIMLPLALAMFALAVALMASGVGLRE
jgi:ABC-2 type transport system permease protein